VDGTLALARMSNPKTVMVQSDGIGGRGRVIFSLVGPPLLYLICHYSRMGQP
jgi:hypothetical protein